MHPLTNSATTADPTYRHIAASKSGGESSYLTALTLL
jgi:hypothetical protein